MTNSSAASAADTAPSGRELADLIAPALPSLRRFARALCGSQDAGDNYVVSTLEAIIADTRMFRHDLPPRVALYQTFLRVWNALPLNRKVDNGPADAGLAADRRLENVTPMPRQAFLLTALEEFKIGEVAAILGLGESKVSELIDTAGKEISQQIAARVMIIEDEPTIALDLQMLIGEIGHEAIGIATTKDEATELAASSKPDVILSDIQLADGSSGIDAVNEILKDINVPVIFITAYPERLLTGERAEPTFLITKPFQPSMVKAILSQALFFDMKAKADSGKAA